MATTRLGLPVVIAIFVVNLATSSNALQSSLLSSLAGQDKSPVLLFLDNSALSKVQSPSRQDSDQTEVDRNLPLLTLLTQLTQPKTTENNHKHSQAHFNRIRNRRPRYQHVHDHRHREGEYEDRNRNDEDRDRRERYYSRPQERSPRGRYRTYREREDRYRRPLRTDDKREPQQEKRERPQNREDRPIEQPKYRAGSAQAQIPVIKSILRSLNCNAKDECQDECQATPKKNECEDECEIKYDCQEEEENDSCDDGCATTKSCTTGGSTKGITLETEKPGCSRC